jgi:lipopolysaccharide export LptBFGC system permease protein LptF
MERLVDPIVADMQAEYGGAAGRGRRHRRAAIWRGYAAFWKALTIHGITRIVQPSKSEPGVSARRVVVFSFAAFALMTALLVAPPMVNANWGGGALERLQLIVLLIPQALPISLPAGVCVGIVCAMRGRRATARHLAATLAIAAVATVAAWTMLEWGIPAGNQAFREVIAARLGDGRPVHLEPGLNELGLSRLAERTDRPAVQTYRLFWAICFATPPFALFALGISVLVRRFAAAVVLGFLTIGLYWLFLDIIDEPFRAGTAPAIVVWLPNITFLVLGVLMLRGSLSARTQSSSEGL